MKLTILQLFKVYFIPTLVFLILLKFMIMGRKIRLPPGPSQLPVIGNLHELFTPVPHRKLRDLAKKFGPLMHLKLGSISTIVVSSAAIAEEILKTNDLAFANRPKLAAPKILGYNYTDIAFAPYGTYWRQLKKVCVIELVKSKRNSAFRLLREQEVALLVQSIASKCTEPISLVELLFALSYDTMTRMVFGRKLDNQNRFRAAMKEGTSLAAGFHVGDFFPSLAFVSKISGMEAKMQKTFLELDSMMNAAIQERVERRKTDEFSDEYLIDVLLRLMGDGSLEVPLTVNNIKSIILDILTGGSEKAPNSIEWAMTEMIKNPRILDKAQAEVREVVGKKATVEESDLSKLSYMKMVIKETFRVHPPVPLLLPRESMESCIVNGYEVPAKTRTLINYWAISRDPLSWQNPDIFEPERFQNSSVDFKGQDFEFIPFGAGRRICPGISIGMVNLELALAALLYHFDWRLPEGMTSEDIDMNETFGMTLYKTSSLLLVPTLHFPLLISSVMGKNLTTNQHCGNIHPINV